MGKRIGLLGGSFNPAHEGHLHISHRAIKILGLDQVWWLVAYQNPLKKIQEMAPFTERVDEAKAFVSRDYRIKVRDDECRLASTYSIDVIRYLKNRYRGYRFVWIMGGDIVAELHHWKEWDQLVRELPLLFVDRGQRTRTIVNCPFVKRFSSLRVKPQVLMRTGSPAWAMAAGPVNRQSSTAIRQLKRAGNRAGNIARIMIQ
ncbi:MAG: nicotinate (nicotinamide) nucleotide adenylyltransferase [Alphaproteobacteria bacterium]|nr:nicotinate (nicotinamide) nucleotide adenylyltransferase [Alphaproteobacteria bacterium]